MPIPASTAPRPPRFGPREKVRLRRDDASVPAFVVKVQPNMFDSEAHRYDLVVDPTGEIVYGAPEHMLNKA